jgi:uncharacterized FlaG/YvyC family protein
MDVQPVDTQSVTPPPPTLLDAAATNDLGTAPVVSSSSSATAPNENGAHAFAQTASQLFSGTPSSGDVTVSIRVAQHPEEIVTIFRDAHGNVIQQVPSEVVVRLAEFFDQQLGSLLDRNA